MNDVWTLDFIHDRLVDGRQFKCLAILDEYTREGLALRVSRSITGDGGLAELSRLMGLQGLPNCIRSDNGHEFISIKVRNWLDELGVETLFIEPGAPWQNGYVESFNSRFRDEFLNMEIFNSIKEAQILAAKWKEDYNENRPHSALDYMTPSRFAASREAVDSASLRSASPTPSRQKTWNQAA
jgi:putative transposase